ncbi:MAG: FeoA family protein [Gemmatimonadota bacterium]
MPSGGWFRGRGRGRRRRKGRGRRRVPRSLAELPEGETGIVETLELPEDVAQRLMELGFLPGAPVVAGKSAPGGDPQVFRVDGSEIALRRETTRNILLKLPE